MFDDRNPYASPTAIGPAPVAYIPAGRKGKKRAPLRPYRSPRRLARVLVAFLGVLASAMTLSGILGIAARLELLPNQGPDDDLFLTFIIYAAIVRILTLVGFFGIAITYCLWTYRVHSNLPILGAQSLRYTAGWAVGWHFVPVAMLWVPYRVFSEIWRGSLPGESYPGPSPLPVSKVLTIWWSMLVVSLIANNVLSIARNSTTISEQFGSLFDLKLALIAWDVVGCTLAALVVRKITANQETKATERQVDVATA